MTADQVKLAKSVLKELGKIGDALGMHEESGPPNVGRASSLVTKLMIDLNSSIDHRQDGSQQNPAAPV